MPVGRVQLGTPMAHDSDEFPLASHCGEHELAMVAVNRSVDLLHPDALGGSVLPVAHQPLDAAAAIDCAREVLSAPARA